MFEGLKNMAGLAGLMKDLPRIRQHLDQVKERLARIEVSAETGGGAVRATANGKMRIVSIEVDQAMMSSLIDPESDDDRALAVELIAGAVNAALEKAQESATQEFATAAEDLGIPIPPGGLQGMI